MIDYAMLSEQFDYNQLKNQPTFGVKQYQNALYRGELSNNGKRHGKGVMIYDTGRVYEGDWIKDQREGQGFERFSNQNEYTGTFADNKPQGFGAYQWLNGDYYEGDWVDGERHGQGKWKSRFGEVYEGEWIQGEATGKGIMTWENGDKYEGEWRNCKKHGSGKDVYADGSVYVGLYQNGLPQGQGEYYWKDGSYYKGLFLNGLKHGKGILFKKSGIDSKKWILYEGHFESDKKRGYGEVKWSNGSEYKGQLEANERHGKGEMRWFDGTVYIGEWKLGKQSGWGTLKIAGEIKTGYFMNNNYMGMSIPLATDGGNMTERTDKNSSSLLPLLKGSYILEESTMGRSKSEVKLLSIKKKPKKKVWLPPGGTSMYRTNSDMRMTHSMHTTQLNRFNQAAITTNPPHN